MVSVLDRQTARGGGIEPRNDMLVHLGRTFLCAALDEAFIP